MFRSKPSAKPASFISAFALSGSYGYGFRSGLNPTCQGATVVATRSALPYSTDLMMPSMLAAVVDRLTEQLVVHRRLADFHEVEGDAVAGGQLRHRPAAGVDRVDLLDGDVLGDVDLAGAQGGRAGRKLRDRPDADLLDLRRAAPVLLVGDHRPVFERVLPLVELVRAGPVRLLVEDLDALARPTSARPSPSRSRSSAAAAPDRASRS